MLHCGLGPEGVRNFLTTLNLRGINPSALKCREREIGKSIRAAAATSMKSALALECRYIPN